MEFCILPALSCHNGWAGREVDILGDQMPTLFILPHPVIKPVQLISHKSYLKFEVLDIKRKQSFHKMWIV